MYIIYSFLKIDTVIKKNEATIHPVFLTGVLTFSQQEEPDGQTLSAIITFVVLGKTSRLFSSNCELVRRNTELNTRVSLFYIFLLLSAW